MRSKIRKGILDNQRVRGRDDRAARAVVLSILLLLITTAATYGFGMVFAADAAHAAARGAITVEEAPADPLAEAFREVYGESSGTAVADEARGPVTVPEGEAVPLADLPIGSRSNIVSRARRYLGMPYVWGAEDPENGFDCSGLIQWVFKKEGMILPRTAAMQFERGRRISRDELRPGDLVFFSTYRRGASHVGIYIGDGNFLHASSASDRVRISPLDGRYERIMVGATRLVEG